MQVVLIRRMFANDTLGQIFWLLKRDSLGKHFL